MKGTKIEWSDFTWNPWIGCTKVSPACTNCYMYKDMARFKRDPSTVAMAKPKWNYPLQRTRKKTWKIPDGSKVFTCSWSDFFHEDADSWRPNAWEMIKKRPGLTFQILTKRPERILQSLPADWGTGYPNVWLGVTVESQEYTPRMDILRKVPAVVRFISFEPLLGKIENLNLEGFHWAILGGESGPKARKTDLDWLRGVAQHCRALSIPIFVKQLGRYWAKEAKAYKVDPKGGGKSRHLWPQDLDHVDFPKVVDSRSRNEFLSVGKGKSMYSNGQVEIVKDPDPLTAKEDRLSAIINGNTLALQMERIEEYLLHRNMLLAFRCIIQCWLLEELVPEDQWPEQYKEKRALLLRIKRKLEGAQSEGVDLADFDAELHAEAEKLFPCDQIEGCIMTKWYAKMSQCRHELRTNAIVMADALAQQRMDRDELTAETKKLVG